jgi:hypothetical protein
MSRPDPVYPDRAVDLTGGQAAYTIAITVPDRPDVEYFVVALPVPLDMLDDTAVTPMQLALEVGQQARDAAQAAMVPAIMERRRG